MSLHRKNVQRSGRTARQAIFGKRWLKIRNDHDVLLEILRFANSSGRFDIWCLNLLELSSKSFSRQTASACVLYKLLTNGCETTELKDELQVLMIGQLLGKSHEVRWWGARHDCARNHFCMHCYDYTISALQTHDSQGYRCWFVSILSK